MLFLRYFVQNLFSPLGDSPPPLTYDESSAVGEVPAAVGEADGPDGVGEGGGPVQADDRDVVLVGLVVVARVQPHLRHAERLVAGLARLVEVVLAQLHADVLLLEGGETVGRRQHVRVRDERGAAVLTCYKILDFI